MERIEFDDRFYFDEEDGVWTANASEVFPSRDFPESFEISPKNNGPHVVMTKVDFEEIDGDIALVIYSSSDDVIKIRFFND